MPWGGGSKLARLYKAAGEQLVPSKGYGFDANGMGCLRLEVRSECLQPHGCALIPGLCAVYSTGKHRMRMSVIVTNVCSGGHALVVRRPGPLSLSLLARAWAKRYWGRGARVWRW